MSLPIQSVLSWGSATTTTVISAPYILTRLFLCLGFIALGMAASEGGGGPADILLPIQFEGFSPDTIEDLQVILARPEDLALMTQYLTDHAEYTAQLNTLFHQRVHDIADLRAMGADPYEFTNNLTTEQIRYIIDRGTHLIDMRAQLNYIFESTLRDNVTVASLLEVHLIAPSITVPGVCVDELSQNGDELFKFFHDNIGGFFSVVGIFIPG